MRLMPKPGFQYRDTATRQLVPTDGFDADQTVLDIARAIDVGDLIPVTDEALAQLAALQSDPAPQPAAPAPDAAAAEPVSGDKSAKGGKAAPDASQPA